MRVQSGHSKALTYGLLGVNGLLLAFLWLQLQEPAPGVPGEAQQAAPPAALALPTEALPHPPLSEFQELSERPLFWAERRLEEAPAAEVVSAGPAASSLSLLGVVITAGEQRALLVGNGAGAPVIRARVGDVVEGWTVESIAPKRVVLNRGGVVTEVAIDERSGTDPAAPAASGRRTIYRPK